jgi:EpsD family peptidyl-prolyl cis-trans isomerase
MNAEVKLFGMGANMKFRIGCALTLTAFLAVGACHRPAFIGGKPAAPTGQVVAVVEGQEITLRDLNAELAGLNVTDPKLRKAAQDEALRKIIGRKILAKAAQDQGIDKTADFALERQRADESLLAEALEQKLAAGVPAPTREEVEHYVSDNPDLFDQRKIMTVDQIRIVKPSDPARLQELAPLNTMPEIKVLLEREHTQYQEGTTQLDTAALGPDVSAKILKLPPNEVFVVPSGGYALINQIQSTVIQPLKGDQAISLATAYLRRKHVDDALQLSVRALLQKGDSTVAYNPAYKPAAPPHAGVGASTPGAGPTAAAPSPASNAAR